MKHCLSLNLKVLKVPAVFSSVVRYLQYLDKYREYQRFNTSIEEVSIYVLIRVLSKKMHL